MTLLFQPLYPTTSIHFNRPDSYLQVEHPEYPKLRASPNTLKENKDCLLIILNHSSTGRGAIQKCDHTNPKAG